MKKAALMVYCGKNEDVKELVQYARELETLCGKLAKLVTGEISCECYADHEIDCPEAEALAAYKEME